VDNQAKEEEDNQDQVMLSAENFHRLAKPSKLAEPCESLAANGNGPFGVTLEGKETDFLDWVHNCTD